MRADHDPFLDPKLNRSIADFENPSKSSISTRGQITLYATAQLARQHRLFIFSLAIFGKFARLFRWDRAGVIVSDRIDYTTDPATLAEYIWRFSHLSTVQRGQDPTVLSPSSVEEELFVEAIRTSSQPFSSGNKMRPLPGIHWAIDQSFPRWKMRWMTAKKVFVSLS